MKPRRFSVFEFLLWFIALNIPLAVVQVLLWPAIAAWSEQTDPLARWRLNAFFVLFLALPAVVAFMLARRRR